MTIIHCSVIMLENVHSMLYLICTNQSWRQPGAPKYHQTSPSQQGAVTPPPKKGNKKWK
jgi:hypothetical protein